MKGRKKVRSKRKAAKVRDQAQPKFPGQDSRGNRTNYRSPPRNVEKKFWRQ